jgi:hypothetical protein
MDYIKLLRNNKQYCNDNEYVDILKEDIYYILSNSIKTIPQYGIIIGSYIDFVNINNTFDTVNKYLEDNKKPTWDRIIYITKTFYASSGGLFSDIENVYNIFNSKNESNTIIFINKECININILHHIPINSISFIYEYNKINKNNNYNKYDNIINYIVNNTIINYLQTTIYITDLQKSMPLIIM